jgi:outer membrane protein OmpA-like peptidoglycan-associated protein
MKRLLLGCAAFFALLPLSFSQLDYVTEQTATGKAKSAYKEGIDHVKAREYDIALGYFEKALKEEPRFIDAKMQLALTYVDLRNFFKAKQYFEEAIAIDANYWPRAYFELADIAWGMDNYEEAARYADLYLKSQPQNPKSRQEAERLFANATFAAQAVKNPVAFDPKSVGDGINTPLDEYFPCLTADGETLVFTRNMMEANMFGQRNEDFYSSQKANGAWQTAKPLKGVNTSLNEGAQSISPDGSWLVFTACNRDDDGAQGSCDLYWSQLKNTGWTTPKPFSSAINSNDWDAQPTIGADNKTLIFASSRPGTLGKLDLWESVRQADGKWSKPQNLGPSLNTEGNEHMPFLHPDGQTLYFASDNLPGMGGNDIFVARRQPDGSWGAPQNLGYPINTKGEEGMLVVSLDGATAYFASNRPGGKGGIDIYQFELHQKVRPQPTTYARAKVRDAATGNALVARVEFSDLKTGQSHISSTTKSDGTFLVCLPAGKDYALNVSKDKYLFYSENFNLVETATFDKPFLLNIDLQPIAAEPDANAPSSKPIALRNVFFETGSAALRSESSAELDRLAALLADAPALRIQINGHTDNVGDDASNQKLSEARAKAVQDYLLNKGIAAERLKFKGFGESQPVESNDTPEGRGRNRRTEFVVW